MIRRKHLPHIALAASVLILVLYPLMDLIRGRSGSTPLHEAIYSQNLIQAKNLVTNGADVNAPSNSGMTPLHAAAISGNEAIAKFLIDHGADVRVIRKKRWWYRSPNFPPSIIDEQGVIPLHFASEPGLALLFIAHGANVNARSKNGYTPLHFAVRGEQPRIVEVLLKHGADVNAKDNKGLTPLHYCVVYSPHPQILKMLLEDGADVHARTKDGKTAAELAKAKHRHVDARLLDDSSSATAKEKK